MQIIVIFMYYLVLVYTQCTEQGDINSKEIFPVSKF